MGYMLDLQDENEGSCTCPYCGSELTHVDFNSLVFMCPECGEYIEFARGSIADAVNIIKDDE